jgi:ribosomal protein S18 acetylase RimI-like enzyme
VLVAGFVDRAAAGVATGYVLSRPAGDRGMALLYSLDVAPPFRRRGLATRIVAALRQVAPGRMWLLTQVTNEGAMALYRSTGGVRPREDDALWVWPPEAR